MSDNRKKMRTGTPPNIVITEEFVDKLGELGGPFFREMAEEARRKSIQLQDERQGLKHSPVAVSSSA